MDARYHPLLLTPQQKARDIEDAMSGERPAELKDQKKPSYLSDHLPILMSTDDIADVKGELPFITWKLAKFNEKINDSYENNRRENVIEAILFLLEKQQPVALLLQGVDKKLASELFAASIYRFKQLQYALVNYGNNVECNGKTIIYSTTKLEKPRCQNHTAHTDTCCKKLLNSLHSV